MDEHNQSLVVQIHLHEKDTEIFLTLEETIALSSEEVSKIFQIHIQLDS